MKAPGSVRSMHSPLSRRLARRCVCSVLLALLAVSPAHSVPACGDGTVEPDLGETCDPPGSPCDSAFCAFDCTCTAVTPCGNGTVDPGESCDPPGFPCDSDGQV